MAKFLCFCLFLSFFGSVTFGMSANNSYIRGLIKYLKKESKLHQVMFIIDDQLLNNSSSSSNFLITKVSQHFPSYTVSMTKLRLEPQNTFPASLQLPKRTTLFIMMLNGNIPKIWGNVSITLALLKKLSRKYSHPKLLINFFSGTKSNLIRRRLEVFWNYQDFTEIEVLEHLQDYENTLTQGRVRQIILHEINEFAKVYTAREVTSQTKWFPNKLLNLNGHKVKFILTTLNNLLTVERHEKLKKFARILTHSLGTSSIIVNVKTAEKKHIINLFTIHKAEIVLNGATVQMIKDNYTQKMRIIRFESLMAIIPVNAKLSNVFEISHEFVYMVLATTIVICAIRFTAFIMKFNKSTWQIFNISRIVIGMSVVREPNKVTERIVFGSLILSCIVYSGYLFSVILDITFRKEPEISSLEELANSSLTPMLTSFANTSLLLSSISYIRQLGMKSIKIPDSGLAYDCLTYLTRYENVTCLIWDVKERLSDIRRDGHDLNVKVLQEPLGFLIRSWEARSGSPFIDHFNKVILEASEAGLLKKLMTTDDGNTVSCLSPSEEMGKETLLLIVSYLLVIGYTVSIIVFIAEMISIIVWRKLNYFCMHFLNVRAN